MKKQIEVTLFQKVLAIGKSIRIAHAKAGALHIEVLAVIGASDGKGGYKQQTVAWWLTRFANEVLVKSPVKYPINEKSGEPLSYKTIINAYAKDSKAYPESLVNICHYLNNFQSYLYSKKLVLKTKQKPAAKSSAGHVVTNDQIVSALQRMLEMVAQLPEGKKKKAIPSIKNLATQFGIKNLELPK